MERNTGQIIMECLTLAVVWILSLVGNSLVCLVIYRSRRMQSTTNYFVVSLACSDLLVIFLLLPFFLVRIASNQWIFGPIMCKVIRFVQYFLPSASLYTLVSICVDRYYTIIYPLSFKVTKTTAKQMIFFCWLISCILSCLCFYFYRVFEAVNNPDVTICPTYVTEFGWVAITYTVSTCVLQYVAPTIIILVGYANVFSHVWQIGSWGRVFKRTTNHVPKTKVKMLKMLMVMTFMTVMLLGPLFCVQVWYSLSDARYVEPTVFIIILLLAIGSGIAKPICYISYNSNFRRGCKEVFCMSYMSCYRQNTYAITTVSNFGRKNYVGVMDSLNSRSLESPRKAFNRAVMTEKSAWPLRSTVSSTYL